MVSRMVPEHRKQLILNAAMGVAGEIGYQLMTRYQIAEAAAVAPGLVSHYFERMADIRAAVMLEAVNTGYDSIVAQGLAAHDPIALNAPRSVRLRVRDCLTLWGPL